MPKPSSPLTDTGIRNAKPADKMYKLSDGAGLALWIYPNGRKVWRIQYRRPADGKFDTITFGPYPQTSLIAARERRDAVRSILLAGQDPKRTPGNDPDNTFKYVARQWWDRWRETVTPGYADQVWRVLEANVMNTLGDKPVTEISARMIVEALEPMEARGALEYLRRARQNIAMIFGFALARGLTDNNPAAGITSAFRAPKSAHFRALRTEEINKLAAFFNSDQIGIQLKLQMRWQLLNLSRPIEAAAARWDEINDGVWTIPGQKMKRRRDHLIPLSRQSMTLLESLRPISGHHPYLFPHRTHPDQYASESAPNVALKRLAIPTTAHGLRALASTTLHESGLFNSDVIELALSHVEQNKVKAAYNRAEYLPQRQELLQWWADFIDKNVGRWP
ncbi:integrase arm-type DNA-binding domain-containing protein [Aquitalea sp. LB_tupeE]|uniref:tyrosine-type recombinase/integrase n=1 Tax=Aquitalea sp. LB_tupeE TaxID=2748078 RepID=UPI0015BB0365|nr:integrase arm-type DNA-binding domain-containing protein [Aquitalea sp. LB_tupeE]NWK79562.1 integrase arm-type DNA-binding domain-containing protein [Aquitalea sp. LB_tupeE]